MSELIDLYPAIDPYASGFLDVSEMHSIYWEQCGNPDGIPVLILHGGPGEGCTALHRRFFDPHIFRIILFDQRGCGRSTPHGEIQQNSPNDLVSDIEKLRTHLSIDKWHLFGGSWGSTLALLYTIQHPNAVEELLLRGIFLLQSSEVDWFLYKTKRFYPKTWKAFAEYIPSSERDDLLAAYHKRLTAGDIVTEQQAAINWFRYEGTCATLIPNKTHSISNDMISQALALARIEAHYFKHHILDGADSILNQVNTINHIPLTVIQGRYDVICPPITAQSLVDHWPNATYHLVDNGAHSMMDPAIKTQLLKVTYQLAEKYRGNENGIYNSR